VTKSRTKRPTIAAANVRTDLSLCFSIANAPTRKDRIPKTPARRPGMASHRLVRKPSPPLSPI